MLATGSWVNAPVVLKNRLFGTCNFLPFYYCWHSYNLFVKEGCNGGHSLSAAIKLGSLEKTVGASLIALWSVLSSLFFVEKTKLHNLLPGRSASRSHDQLKPSLGLKGTKVSFTNSYNFCSESAVQPSVVYGSVKEVFLEFLIPEHL